MRGNGSAESYEIVMKVGLLQNFSPSKGPFLKFIDPSNARAKFLHNHLVLVSSLACLLYSEGYDDARKN